MSDATGPDPRPRGHVGRTIRKTIHIQAPAGEVYAHWADPDKIARWFVDHASGRAAPGEVMQWRFDSMNFEMPVPILEAVSPERLVIGGEVPGQPPRLLEVTVEVDDQGRSTILRLANSGFRDGSEWDDEYQGVDRGWTLALATLKFVLESSPPGERMHVFAMRPGRFEYEALRPLYETREGLESWLAGEVEVSGEPLEVGVRVVARGDHGLLLEGEVVERTPHEILIHWPEHRGLLTLKAFAMGAGQRAVALDFNAWTERPPERAAMERLLNHALDRLQEKLSAPTRSS